MTWYAMFTQLRICKSGECIDIVITRNLVIFSWKHSFLNFHKFAKSNRCIKKNYIGLVFSFSGYIGKSKLNRNEDHGTLSSRIGNYIVCDFHLSQSKHSTSKFIGRRLTCCGRRRKHWIEIPFSKLSFNSLVFTQWIEKTFAG